MPETCDFCGKEAVLKRDIVGPEGLRVDVPVCISCSEAYEDGILIVE